MTAPQPDGIQGQRVRRDKGSENIRRDALQDPRLSFNDRMINDRVHDLKTWPGYWEAIASGRKTAEIRWDDRDYRVGDVLILREIINDGCAWSYTARVCQRRVTHVLQGDQFGLARGYVALSLCSVVTPTTDDDDSDDTEWCTTPGCVRPRHEDRTSYPKAGTARAGDPMIPRASRTYFELDDAWNDPGWSRVLTTIARCTTVSRAAKGLAMEIASLPPGNSTSIAALAQLSSDGRDATRSKVVELEEAGFLTRHRTRGPKGFGIVVYQLTDPSEVAR